MQNSVRAAGLRCTRHGSSVVRWCYRWAVRCKSHQSCVTWPSGVHVWWNGQGNLWNLWRTSLSSISLLCQRLTVASGLFARGWCGHLETEKIWRYHLDKQVRTAIQPRIICNLSRVGTSQGRSLDQMAFGWVVRTLNRMRKGYHHYLQRQLPFASNHY